MSRSTEPDELEPTGTEDIALAKLNKSVRVIDKRVRRGESQRKWMWLMVLLTLVAILAQFFLYTQVIMGRSDARQYYNQQNVQQNRQLHQLACELASYRAPGDNEGDDLRGRYHCPPPANAPSSQFPTSTEAP